MRRPQNQRKGLRDVGRRVDNRARRREACGPACSRRDSSGGGGRGVHVVLGRHRCGPRRHGRPPRRRGGVHQRLPVLDTRGSDGADPSPDGRVLGLLRQRGRCRRCRCGGGGGRHGRGDLWENNALGVQAPVHHFFLVVRVVLLPIVLLQRFREGHGKSRRGRGPGGWVTFLVLRRRLWAHKGHRRRVRVRVTL